MSGIRMTEDQYLAIIARRNAAPSIVEMRDNPQAKQPKQKYRNTKVEDQGVKFDSKAEHRRWVYLVDQQKKKVIKNLRRQVTYELIPKQARPSGGYERATNYIADMVYEDHEGRVVVEDVKGHATPEYRLKRKLMLWVHGIEVKEIRS